MEFPQGPVQLEPPLLPWESQQNPSSLSSSLPKTSVDVWTWAVDSSRTSPSPGSKGGASGPQGSGKIRYFFPLVEELPILPFTQGFTFSLPKMVKGFFLRLL